MTLDPTTELTLAVLRWKNAEQAWLAEAARRLAAAGTAYLAAEFVERVPDRKSRPYTSQLANAAVNAGTKATRPHERQSAIGAIEEVEALSKAELAAERDALKKAARTAPVEAKPLNPERYDVREGLLG